MAKATTKTLGKSVSKKQVSQTIVKRSTNGKFSTSDNVHSGRTVKSQGDEAKTAKRKAVTLKAFDAAYKTHNPNS